MNRCWFLLNVFLLSWYDCVIFLLWFIDVVDYTEWFWNIEPTLHLRNKPHLFTVYNFLSVVQIGWFFIVLAFGLLIFYFISSIFLLSQFIKVLYFCSSCQEGHVLGWSGWLVGCHLSGHNMELLGIDLCSQNRSQEPGGVVRCQDGRTGVWPSSVQAEVWPGHRHIQNQVDIQTEMEKCKFEKDSGCPFFVLALGYQWWRQLPPQASDILWCPRSPTSQLVPSPPPPIWVTFPNGGRPPGPKLHVVVRLSDWW